MGWLYRCPAVLLAVQRSPFHAAKYSTYFISALCTCALGMAFFFHCAPGVLSRPQRRTGGGLWPPPVRSPCIKVKTCQIPGSWYLVTTYQVYTCIPTISRLQYTGTTSFLTKKYRLITYYVYYVLLNTYLQGHCSTRNVQVFILILISATQNIETAFSERGTTRYSGTGVNVASVHAQSLLLCVCSHDGYIFLIITH